MTVRAIFLAAALALTQTAAAAPSAAGPTSKELLAGARRATAISGAGLHAIVRLTAKRGNRSLVRRMELWSAKDGKATRLRVLDPADLRGTGVLIEKTSSGVRRTLYLPELRLSRPLSTRQSLDQLLSTDLRYADLDLLDDDLYEFSRQTNEASGVFRLVGRPRSTDAPYGEVDVLIDPNTRVPTRMRAWDRSGQLVQTIETIDTEADGNGRQRIRKGRVGQTEIILESSEAQAPDPTELTRAALEDAGS